MGNHIRIHLKMYSWEKSNKCTQCNYNGLPEKCQNTLFNKLTKEENYSAHSDYFRTWVATSVQTEDFAASDICAVTVFLLRFITFSILQK